MKPQRVDSGGSPSGSRISVERVFGVVLVMLSLVCMYDLHRATNLVYWDEFGPGPSWLPYAICVILLVLALALIIPRSRTVGGQLGASPAGTLKYVVLVLALAWAFPVIGARLSLGLFVVIEMIWVERQRWTTSLAVGVVTSLAVWLIFARMLGVNLPTGPFGL
jgi:putative tricarboxylic transport membrane protein